MTDVDRAVLARYIVDAVVSYLEEFGDDTSSIGEDTILVGPDGVADSLGLVNIIVAVEQKLLDEHGLDVVLANERAFTERGLTSLSIARLTDYAHGIVQAARAASA